MTVVAQLLCILLQLKQALSGDNDIIFSGDTPIIVSNKDRLNNTALNATLQDFIYDFYNTFGIAPVTFDPSEYTPCTLSTSAINTTITATISALYIGIFSSNSYPISLLPNQDISTCYNGTESHCVKIVYDNNLSQYAMIAMSNDTLGAMYSLYSISQYIFGIDPLYRFSGISGFDYSDVGYLTIRNTTYFNTKMQFNQASFKYRAIFTNDEDLLGGFGADPYGESVFSGTILMYIFETLLRLKGNMLQIGTITYPDEISIKLAYKRGIYIQAASHFNLFNSNTKQFPAEIEYEWEWDKYPMTPKFVWISSITSLLEINLIPNENIIWSVGYRGLWDESAPCNNCTEKQRGEMTSQVIGNMTEWLDNYKDSNMITFMWDEGIDQLSKGYLKIPEMVSIILTDNGNGIINYVQQYGNISDGIYTHTAMYNGAANQLTELSSPVRHFEQIGNFGRKSRKNKYAIINTSDLKPVLLSTSAVFDCLWDINECDNDGNEYILNWCLRMYLMNNQNVYDESNYFIAKQIAILYQRYYNISYVMNNGQSDNYISNTIINIATQFIDGINITNSNTNGSLSNSTVNNIKKYIQPNTTIEYINSLFTDSMQLYYNQILGNLSLQSIQLFEEHVLLQQSYHYYGQKAINNICYAASNDVTNNVNINTALKYLDDALDNLQSIFKWARKVEQYNGWRGLYYNARLSDFQRARSYVKKLSNLIENGYNYNYNSNSNSKSCQLPVRPFKYYSFTWYQLPQKDNYPFFYYNQSFHLNTYIRMYCINTGSQIDNINVTNCCINNVNGGVFSISNGCNAMIELNVLRWDICKYIRYTLDETIPNQMSLSVMQNNNVINITQSTVVQARCQYFNGELDSQITTATFNTAL